MVCLVSHKTGVDRDRQYIFMRADSLEFEGTLLVFVSRSRVSRWHARPIERLPSRPEVIQEMILYLRSLGVTIYRVLDAIL